MLTGSHHVREREKRWHQRVVLVDRKDEERSVRLGTRMASARAPWLTSVPKNPLVRPKIAAADAGSGDADERVGWLIDTGVRDVFNTKSPAPNMRELLAL